MLQVCLKAEIRGLGLARRVRKAVLQCKLNQNLQEDRVNLGERRWEKDLGGEQPVLRQVGRGNTRCERTAQKTNWVVGSEAGERGGPGHAGTSSHSREFHLHPQNAGSNWSVLRDGRTARVDMGKARRLLIEDRRLG